MDVIADSIGPRREQWHARLMPAVTTTTAADGGIWSPAVRRLTTGLVLTITLVAFQSLAVATVMPTISAELDGLALYGWVFSGFFLASLLAIVVSGQAADRRGLAAPFVLGLAVFAAGLLVAGLAPSMPVLIAARCAQGFGAGAVPAIGYAAIARGYPPAARPRMFAVLSTAWVLPGLAGPAVATVIERAASWRAVFAALLPLVVVAAVMAVPALRTLDRASRAGVRSPARAGGPALRRALALVGGVGAVLLATGGRVPARTALALGVVGAAVAVRAFVGLVPAGTLRLRPGVPATVGVRGILTFAFFSTDAYLSLAVVEGRGGSTLQGGLALTAAAMTWTAGAWTQERRLTADGPRRLDTIGFALLFAGIAGVLGVALGLPLWIGVVAWAVGGFGMGLAYAPLSLTVLAAARRGEEGAASTALQLADTLGVSLGTGVGGALIALADARGRGVTTGVALAFAASALAAGLGVLAARRLPARIPAGPDPEGGGAAIVPQPRDETRDRPRGQG